MCGSDPPSSLSLVLAGSAVLTAMFRLAGVLITEASHRDKRQDKKKKKNATATVNKNSSSLSKSETATAATETTSLLLEENGDDGNDGRDDARLGPVGAARLYTLSFLSHLVLSVIFFVGAWTSPTMSLMLRYATLAVALHVCAQGVDPARGFFGVGQRSLYAVSCLCLCEAGVFMVVLNSGEEPCYSSFEIVMLASMVVYWPVLVALEIWLSPPPPKENGDGGSGALSMEALSALLRPYVWPDGVLNRCLVVTTWLCVVGAKLCNLVSPVLLGRASTALTQADYGQTIWLSTQYALLNFASKFFKEGQSLAYLKVAQAAFVSLASAAFRHLHNLSLDWHLKKRLGTVLRSMDRGIGACDTLMKYVFLWLFPTVAESLLVCVIFAVYFQYKPLSVAVFIFVFCYGVLTIVLTLWRKKFRKAVAASDNNWHDVCTDSLVNFETVKYFSAEAYESAKFDRAVSSFQTGNVHVQASLSALNLAQQILFNACLAVCLALTAMAVQDRRDCCAARVPGGCSTLSCCGGVPKTTCPGMDVGDFVTVLTYLQNLFQPLNFLGSVYNAIVMAIVDLTNLSELMAEKSTVTDMAGCVHLPPYNAYDEDVTVEFEDVYFHYPTQASNSGLKGVDFVMKRGETTAVVGSTGAGKTTISRLLFRFYDVLHGVVKVNGVDLRSVSQHSLRDTVGFVPQTTTLFNDTIRNNILYGRRDATQYDLDRVARDARLSDFIASLPQGWDTMVGDRGLKLSGGEKQRVSIARCLLKDPPIVVLDEATSALDTITENSVQLALDRLGKDRTCLVIAHRLGTVRNADNIIVLDDGVVAEQGTHDELLAAEGLYADMWNMQLHTGTGSSGSLTALKAEVEATTMVVTKGEGDDSEDNRPPAASKE